ncbi:DNA methyltransferase [Helicobacter pullorum]|uniref:site-specific DNA-methyltransferase (cytosine-N(4)-specific) n=1 Tax=Helicobacter pullorum TaxID=35818 RepID=A0A0N1EIG2_9HELI|nr:DNA methyltransferase [Helicobacter pullorum]KPH53478.1 DNA modification methylase [Helicobacter pullorum]KPH55905.1 DNA modification methylase [Helicobacter pullorum]OCR03301.1 DNA modification methylase [Helicobacter pullorum]OCR06002.1 DNA modification methylase [Helicobacter pullorum]OCR11805.1 DNA modification methylase [Helicobacter pullorum]
MNVNVSNTAPIQYKRYVRNDFSKIHQMTAYLAMFPPNLPYFFIKHYSKINDIVFDPFSGRGTTAFEACRMGRIGIGNDLNPLAFCLTKSKVNMPKQKNIYKRLQTLKQNYQKISIENISEDITMLYDETLTLPQLFYLKHSLNKANKIDNFILAALTGIMHGKHRKNGTSMYCSIDMPNTFSMSPNYIKNFIKMHSLTKIKQDVFELLEQRIEWLFRERNKPFENLVNYRKGECFCLDAIKCSKKIMKKYGKNSVQLIVTSPPYLKNIHYGKYNWIRLWLLNEEVKNVDKTVSIYHKTQSIKGLKDNLPFESYASYMQNLFNSWYNILKPKSYAFVVIGDIGTQNLAKDTWQFIQENGGCKLNLINILEDLIEDRVDKKVTRIWGQKRGQATKIDRILVLQKEW